MLLYRNSGNDNDNDNGNWYDDSPEEPEPPQGYIAIKDVEDREGEDRESEDEYYR